MDGVGLIFTHPEIPNCADCQRFVYRANWTKAEKPVGYPLLRGPREVPPCGTCPKTSDKPPGARGPSPEKELSAKNWRAFMFYQEIKAGAPMPADDRIVRRNCALIRMVEDSIQRQQSNLAPLLLAMLPRGQVKGKP